MSEEIKSDAGSDDDCFLQTVNYVLTELDREEASCLDTNIKKRKYEFIENNNLSDHIEYKQKIDSVFNFIKNKVIQLENK